MTDKQNVISEQQVAEIQALAQNLQYGAITLVFQDGKLVQINKDEKIRVKV